MLRLFYIIILFLPITLFSQEININTIIKYDDDLEDLIRKHQAIENKNGINGWRIQIAFASKKSKITQEKIRFINKFPDITSIYLTYNAPYYKLRIGNFRSKLEAQKVKYEIDNHYPGAYLVPEKLPITELNY